MFQMALYSPTKEENGSLITFTLPNLINQEAFIRYNITYAYTNLKYVNSLLSLIPYDVHLANQGLRASDV